MMSIAKFWRIGSTLDKQIDIDHSFESFRHDLDAIGKVYEQYLWSVHYQVV